MCDFCFPAQKLIIEADGDFWHCNPKKYPSGATHPHQVKGINKDKAKSAYIKKVDDGSWTLIRLWESDIEENVVECIDNVVMPAKNMIDETYTEPPTLFEHFAGVANKIGVYTANDYANIVKKLNRNFKVAEASVTGMAAKSQEHLCNLPERLERFAERTKYRMTKPVGFDWIYGRTA